MQRNFAQLLLILLFFITFRSPVLAQLFPIAPQALDYDTVHNIVRADPYAWMEDIENPEVKRHLRAENRYTRKWMRSTKGLQKRLFNEFTGRVQESDSTLPYKFKAYWYYERYDAGAEYEVIYRRKDASEASEEVVFDLNQMARAYDYYELLDFEVSLNNQFAAYLVDTKGDGRTTLYFKDLVTHVSLPYSIENVSMVAWADDHRTVVYALMDSTKRSYQVWQHYIDTDPKEDQLIFEEKDPTFSVGVYQDKSEEYVFLESSSSTSSEIHYVHLDSLARGFNCFKAREKDHLYYIAYYNNFFYVYSNKNATNFQLLKTPVQQTQETSWQTVVAARENVLLEDFEIFRDYLVLVEKENGLTNIRIQAWDQSEPRYIKFQEGAYSAFLDENTDFDTHTLRYGYESFLTPLTIYAYDMRSQEQKVLKENKVLGAYQAQDYHTQRVYVRARDGKKIPVSLVYKKSLKKSEGNPLFLEGYGAYGLSYDVYFNSDIFSLLDRGVIYAVAHVRGGSELGLDWYEDGKLLHKKNTFRDFIDVSEYLIQEKYTQADQLVAYGASAGGLLMGVIANERPDLYRGVILDVPFVDVLNTMLNPNLPLTTSEYEEWGNPNQKEYYDYIASYSPYDQIKVQAYPSMMFISAIFDSSVGYWEPSKMVARLRVNKTDKNALLLSIDLKSGHGGASGRYARWKEIAFMYAYVLKLLDLDQ